MLRSEEDRLQRERTTVRHQLGLVDSYFIKLASELKDLTSRCVSSGDLPQDISDSQTPLVKLIEKGLSSPSDTDHLLPMGDDETSSPTEQFPTMLDLLLSFSDPPTEVQSENDMHIDDTSDDEDTDAFQTTDSNLKELQRVEEKQDKLIHNINRGLDARRKLLAEVRDFFSV